MTQQSPPPPAAHAPTPPGGSQFPCIAAAHVPDSPASPAQPPGQPAHAAPAQAFAFQPHGRMANTAAAVNMTPAGAPALCEPIVNTRRAETPVNLPSSVPRQNAVWPMQAAPQQPPGPTAYQHPDQLGYSQHSRQHAQQQQHAQQHQQHAQQQQQQAPHVHPSQQQPNGHAQQQPMQAAPTWQGWPQQRAGAVGSFGPAWQQQQHSTPHSLYGAMQAGPWTPSQAQQQFTPHAAMGAARAHLASAPRPAVHGSRHTPPMCYSPSSASTPFHSGHTARQQQQQQQHGGAMGPSAHAWQARPGMPQGHMPCFPQGRDPRDGGGAFPVHPGHGAPQPHLTPPAQHAGHMPGHGPQTAPLPARTPVLGGGRRNHAAAFPNPQSVPVPAAQKRPCPDGMPYGGGGYAHAGAAPAAGSGQGGAPPAPREAVPAVAAGASAAAAAAAVEFSSSEVHRLQQLAEKGQLRPQERERVLHHWVLTDEAGAAAGATGGSGAAGSRKGKGLSSAKEDPRAFVSVKRGAAAGGRPAERPRAVAAPAAAGSVAALFTSAGTLDAGGGPDAHAGQAMPPPEPKPLPLPAAQVGGPALPRAAAAGTHAETPPARVHADLGAAAADVSDAGNCAAENDGSVLNRPGSVTAAGHASAAAASPGGRNKEAAGAEKAAARGDPGSSARGGGRAAAARGSVAGNRPRFSCPRVQRTPPDVAALGAPPLPGGVAAVNGAHAQPNGATAVPGGDQPSAAMPQDTALRRPVIAGAPPGVRVAGGAAMVASGWSTGAGEEVRVSRAALEAARARHALRNSLAQGEE
eukprot:jgi/Ulvmu1/10993/UM007_0173.1